ncbi:sensor histidine kinase [Rhodobacter capsulatus]|jgi:two-component system phosphate regulon sensor histidine kinase PhoR|uniref:sensor histidine kinase n=1 Tax=Rhodobacter capsulatus TaxID=1061 RepID=UPI0003D2C84E|nr:ATP-binding protein [Rhodobacter capsulatus]ETD01622.1 ATPase [Rhodobacter capsulatus DE442]ETD76689.1 ATPase [Rhodobacter capsulatus R121]ETD84455.1 ATPase [Rhodobacter capsulatus YW1]ETD85974.1 ATPase [Rhodobacter capsulatus B6]ETD91936.1 ATPase [Rhodobacter capsulatus YW2]
MADSSTISLAETLPFPILLVSPAQRVLHANSGAEALLGTGLVGRTLVTVLRQPGLIEAVEAVLAGQGRQQVRLRLGSQGRETQVLVTVAALAEGSLVLTFEDRTAVETAEAMRRDFVANVSHELRTPLTALMGFVETLRGAAKDDPVARDRFLAIMEREAGRMNRLVGDLLSLSRVEAEERRRPTTGTDLGAVLRGAMQALAPLAEARQVQLLREGLTEGLKIPADPDQLTQVFTNLIENAIKYGGSGGEVRISVDKIDYEPVLRGAALRVVVADRGEGIDPIHLPRLTERFYRIDTHRSREQGGTGLGLAIVKHIVLRHRGRMKIESEKGQGSRFLILLPVS